jgi:hypothetical protein
MFVLSVVLTILLLLETAPSAVAGLTRAKAGMTRLDQGLAVLAVNLVRS